MFKRNYLVAYLNESYKENTFNNIDNLMFKYKINGILSSKILDLYDLNEIYNLNIKLLEKLNRNSPKYKLYKEEDYKILLPYLDSNGTMLFSYINEKIIKLYQYDLSNKTNYIDTLYAYLINERSLNQTSEVLYLHKNIIIYRLSKKTKLLI